MSEESILSAIRRLEQKVDQMRDEVRDRFQQVNSRLDSLEEQLSSSRVNGSKNSTYHHQAGGADHSDTVGTRYRRDNREDPASKTP